MDTVERKGERESSRSSVNLFLIALLNITTRSRIITGLQW